jgi:DNA topoisomerase-1
LEEKFEAENKTKKVKPEGKGATIEKMEENVTKLDQKIETLLVQAEDKESNKEVALGTSKIVSHRTGWPLFEALLTNSPELYRPSAHCCLLQEFWRPD